MDSILLQDQLEELAHKLSITLRYESIESEESLFPGGLCRIRGEQVVIINSSASSEEQIGTLGRALIQFDLTGLYLRPAVRDFLSAL